MSEAPQEKKPRAPKPDHAGAHSEASIHAIVVGQVVARLRQARGWTQDELAWRAASNQSMISRIEQGKREVSPFLLASLASAFEVSPEKLAAFFDSAYRRVERTAASMLPKNDTAWWETALQIAGVVGLVGLATFVVAAVLAEES